uniref:Uncharacterized protein n=1 Tax=Zea mays TaxID=4577 RepID=A0A804M8S8_MAIZE
MSPGFGRSGRVASFFYKLLAASATAAEAQIYLPASASPSRRPPTSSSPSSRPLHALERLKSDINGEASS